ncbi:hypothetical protein [Streptomyces prunicolor]|uniref:hypothetical protein n=1 Tax=Streptomyces prunicolor TaxID=67348 RepID=UPI003403FE68
MTEINRHDAPPGVNDIEAYQRLLHLPHLTVWTTRRKDEHSVDTREYEAALGAFQSALRSEHIEGDGMFAGTASRRARRVEKHLKALVKASRQAEESLKNLRTSYADHIAHVRALPGQREAKAARKAGRREAVTELTAKSLQKSATSFTPHAAEAVVPDAQEAAEAAARPAVRGVNDLWNQQQRRGA